MSNPKIPAKSKMENQFGFKGEIFLFLPPDSETKKVDDLKDDCKGIPLGITIKYNEKVKVKEKQEDGSEKDVEKNQPKSAFLIITDAEGNPVTENDDFQYQAGKAVTYKTGTNAGKPIKDKNDKEIKPDATAVPVSAILKSLKRRLSALERAISIEKNKEKPNTDAIQAEENKILALKYKGSEAIIKEEDADKKAGLIAKAEKQPYYVMLQKHLLTISKPAGKKIAKVELGEAGMEIEKSVFVKKFEMDPKGTGASMIPEKVIIERFEVDFETGEAAVSVATEPGDDFILNRYGDLIYLQSAQVIYIRTAQKVIEPAPQPASKS